MSWEQLFSFTSRRWPIRSERLRNRDSLVDIKNCEVLQEILWLDFTGCGCRYACSQSFTWSYTHTHTRLGCSIPLLKMQSSLSVARVGSHLLLSILHAWAKHVPVWGGNTFHMRPSVAFVSWCHTLVMHSGRDWTYTNKFLKKVRFSVLPHFAGLQRNNVHVHNNLRRTLLWTLISWPRHRCLCPSCSKSFYFCLSKNETLLIPSDWAIINISWLKRRDENNVTMSKGLLVVAARLQLLRFVSFLPFSLCYY